jgi:hypothetical protein
MPRTRIDVVIEAVRYGPDGKITLVRTFERRGPVWSDRQLLDRGGLILRLEGGERVVAGRRKKFLGSSMEYGIPVHYADGAVTTEKMAGGADRLMTVPVF